MPPGPLLFDIHGLLTLRVAENTPSAGRFQEMFGPFQTSGVSALDIDVGGPPRPLDQPVRIKWTYRYTESCLESIDDGWQVCVDAACIRVAGRGDLLPVALPLVDRLLVERGAALVHAAGVRLGERGVCLPAWGGTGKTSVMAQLASVPGAGFCGDDLVLLDSTGSLLSFPKRIWIKSHHRDIYADALHQQRRRPLPYKFAQRRVLPALRPLLKRFPQVRVLAKGLSPLLPAVPVAPEEALGMPVVSGAPLALTVLLESYEGEVAVCEATTPDQLARRLVGQFEADVLRESREAVALLAATGLVPLEAHLAGKVKLLRGALAAGPAYRLRVPASLSRADAAELIAREVLRLLA
jgi:hypothetical protein